MADLIRLLPDGVINQIAAGEVIQRPASVVKELIDNALDSGATEIRILIRDAGKTLIQINDNGSGMSPTDARMAFERHATSKIQASEDLFKIHTKGFRGEALASMASVAQVEMKTRPHDHVTGTRVLITESKVKLQEPCACSTGTQIQVKNLFFNVPARRKFLKSDSIENRHIQDEFIHQALSYPDVAFSLQINDQVIYKLVPSSLKQRIIGLFGKKYQDHLLPVQPETGILEVSGFVGKPEIARKTKGEQYLFVNRRAIRSPFLQHAIKAAFDHIIPPELHAFYVLFLNLDPEKIDINVHPSKQEIKFEDERLIYQFLKAAVRFSLAKYSITPQLDFESANPGIERMISGSTSNALPSIGGHSVSWTRLAFPDGLPPANSSQEVANTQTPQESLHKIADFDSDQKGVKAQQYFGTYIVVQLPSGLTIIDQQLASERILYEHYRNRMKTSEGLSQSLLFPQTLHLNRQDAILLAELIDPLRILGFDLEPFGTDSYLIRGVPAKLEAATDEQNLIEQVLEQYRSQLEIDLSLEDRMARAMAASSCVKRHTMLQQLELDTLVEQLFLCEVPYSSPSGRKCIFHLSVEELQKKFS